jgi:hypothetical protein
MIRRKPTRLELHTQNEAKKFIEDQKKKIEEKRKEKNEEKINLGLSPIKHNTIDERIGYQPDPSRRHN